VAGEPTPVFAGGRLGAGVVLLLVGVVILLLAAFGSHPGLSWEHFFALGCAASFAGILLLVIGV
jgi:hypothetical protein